MPPVRDIFDFATGILLVEGGDGVEADPVRGVDLCTRAIEEGANTSSMFLLTCLLVQGTGIVEADSERAVELYYFATEEGGDNNDISNLGCLLRSRA